MVKKIRQRDISDCGAACLVAVAAHYRINLSVAALRRYSGTDRTGTSVLGLIQAADSIGLSAKGVKGRLENFSNELLPAIAHVSLPDGLQHFVVVTSIRNGFVNIMDPREGAFKRLSHRDFEAIWTKVAVLFAPNVSPRVAEGGAPPQAHSVLWHFCRLARPHRHAIVQSIVGALVASILGLGTTLYVRITVDRVLGEGDTQLVNILGIAMVGIVSVRALLSLLQARLHHHMILRIDAQLITEYQRHLFSLPQQFFDTMRSGEVLTRVTDAIKVRSFLNDVLLQAVINSFVVILNFGFIWYLAPPVAAATFFVLLIFTALFLGASALNRAGHQQIIETNAEFGAEISETLSAAATIKRLSLETTVSSRIESKLVKTLRASDDVAQKSAVFSSLNNWLIQASLVALLWAGTSMVLDARYTAGEILSCYTLAGFMSGPISSLFGVAGSLHQAKIAANRLFEIMDLESERTSGVLGFPSDISDGLTLSKIHFAHPGRVSVLKGATLHFPAGKISILTGESGCGKSTVLSLIQRIYTPTAGQVLIGDVALEEIRISDIRANVSIVPQKIELFSDTILNNITIGDPHPDPARAVEICRRLGIHQFISELPLRYSTMLTEGGANLSGGQRQRIAIARAIYRAPRILLMDEPSSALDGDSEAKLIEVLKDLSSRGMLIVLAAHNKRIVAEADVIYNFEGGLVHRVMMV